MITLNNLIALIQTFVSSHLQIKTWYLGNRWDELSGGQSIAYPMLFGDLKGSQVSGTTDTFQIEFCICDKVEKGNRAMLLEVLSDTKLMALDFLSYANSMSSSIVINKEISFEEATEIGDDEVAGWFFTVEFKQKFEYDKCSIPLN